MTDTERERINAICEVARVKDIRDLSDGFHTFNGLYEQRAILFAALVKAYRDKAWKSYRHEYGEYCFGGGWFIVGIDTPEGSYTYHYENKYWDMFDCVDLPRAKHWDGHTEEDAETRLMSLEPAEPEKRTDKRTETHACDLIDREAAVDAIYHHLPSVSRTRARTMLHEVPSAQPEIVRCKDCKHFHYDMPYVIQGIPVLGHEVCDFWGDGCKTSENGFCSFAERRTDGVRFV